MIYFCEGKKAKGSYNQKISSKQPPNFIFFWKNKAKNNKNEAKNNKNKAKNNKKHPKKHRHIQQQNSPKHMKA